MIRELLVYRDVWLIGAGGKTTLMYWFAKAWRRLRKPCICTTTTRIFPPTKQQCADMLVGEYGEVCETLAYSNYQCVTVLRKIEQGKGLGFTAAEALSFRDLASHVVVEADGSAGKPIKAHREDEPVVSEKASCVVAVIGGWAVGRLLDGDSVHRPELFAQRCGKPIGSEITARDVTRVVFHRDGWLRGLGENSDIYIALTGPDNGLGEAFELAARNCLVRGIVRLPEVSTLELHLPNSDGMTDELRG